MKDPNYFSLNMLFYQSLSIDEISLSSEKISKSINISDIINEFINAASFDLLTFTHRPIIIELKNSYNCFKDK